MNNLLDNEEDDQAPHRDREITLGTSTILGIFFALAIICAAFFGFGYSLGSKHTSPNLNANGDAVGTRNFSAFKPPPGSPINSAATSYAPPTAAPPPGPLPAATLAHAAAPGTTAPPEASEGEPPVVKPPKVPPPAPAAVVAAAATSSSSPQSFVVQVAALTHQEDADLIRSTLERRGYTVGIRADPQDKLLHVQIGPFNNRKDAEAMRQKLLADGFNAYIK